MHVPGGPRARSGLRRVVSRTPSVENATNTANNTSTAVDTDPMYPLVCPQIAMEVEGLKARPVVEGGVQPGHEVDTKKSSYTIFRELARGRMARVFEVVRAKDQKRLALKVHVAMDPGTAQLLRREAHIYAELATLARSDKLPLAAQRFFSLYDYGETPDGQFLFLTLGGNNLASVMSEEKIPDYQSALDMSLQMLEAIEQLHTHGFMHCRVRPQVFVTGRRAEEKCRLFIVNLSLAKMANPGRVEGNGGAKLAVQCLERHAPRCQHTGAPYNRRDDLESWFFICCDLFHPQFLPWSGEKRLKSAQIGELKEKLLKGEMWYRFSVLPKPFQAMAGAIYETESKPVHFSFFRECLETEAKRKECVFGKPWGYRPAADLPPVPETGPYSRAEVEFQKKLNHPTAYNFGVTVSRTLPPDAPAMPNKPNTTPNVEFILPGKVGAKDSKGKNVGTASGTGTGKGGGKEKDAAGSTRAVSMSDVLPANKQQSAPKPKLKAQNSNLSKEDSKTSQEMTEDDDEDEATFAVSARGTLQTVPTKVKDGKPKAPPSKTPACTGCFTTPGAPFIPDSSKVAGTGWKWPTAPPKLEQPKSATDGGRSGSDSGKQKKKPESTPVSPADAAKATQVQAIPSPQTVSKNSPAASVNPYPLMLPATRSKEKLKDKKPLMDKKQPQPQNPAVVGPIMGNVNQYPLLLPESGASGVNKPLASPISPEAAPKSPVLYNGPVLSPSAVPSKDAEKEKQKEKSPPSIYLYPPPVSKLTQARRKSRSNPKARNKPL